MVPLAKLYLERAENELATAELLFKISADIDLKKSAGVPLKFTFYSGAISHAYYAIFNAAKGILAQEGVKTYPPDVHKKTLNAFREHFVDSGKLNVKLLTIYKQLYIRAESLLGIFKTEKKKRGDFTYKRLPQANQQPAAESTENARTFYKHIAAALES